MGRKHRAKKKKDDLFKVILLEVFLKRVPEKSDIGRCRCVCKKWRSSLSTPEFIRAHLQVTIDDYKLLLIDEENEPSFPFRIFSFDQTLPPFNIPNSLSDPIPDVSIIASLDGLVCLGLYREGEVDPTLLLMNPFIGAFKRLAPIPEYGCRVLSVFDPMGFYFDSCDNDYKLLCLFFNGCDGATVYSHRLDSWRDIEFPIPCPDQLLYWSPATFYRQGLYFDVTCCFGGRFRVVSRIIRFDVKTETFKEITVPDLANATDATHYYSAGLVVLKGCLHLYVTYNISDVEDGVDVWKMKKDDDDDDDEEEEWEWEKVHAFTRLQQQQEQLMCTETTDNWLAVLDQRDNSFKKMHTEDFKTRYPCFSSAVRDYTASRLIYVQTLVNP